MNLPIEIIIQIIKAVDDHGTHEIVAPSSDTTKTLLSLSLVCSDFYVIASQMLRKHCVYIDSRQRALRFLSSMEVSPPPFTYVRGADLPGLRDVENMYLAPYNYTTNDLDDEGRQAHAKIVRTALNSMDDEIEDMFGDGQLMPHECYENIQDMGNRYSLCAHECLLGEHHSNAEEWIEEEGLLKVAGHLDFTLHNSATALARSILQATQGSMRRLIFVFDKTLLYNTDIRWTKSLLGNVTGKMLEEMLPHLTKLDEIIALSVEHNCPIAFDCIRHTPQETEARESLHRNLKPMPHPSLGPQLRRIALSNPTWIDKEGRLHMYDKRENDNSEKPFGYAWKNVYSTLVPVHTDDHGDLYKARDEIEEPTNVKDLALTRELWSEIGPLSAE